MNRFYQRIINFCRTIGSKTVQYFPKVRVFFYLSQQKTRRIFKKTAYWGGVCIVGLSIAGIIMSFNGVPVVYAQSSGIIGSVARVILAFIYYVPIMINGIIAMILAFILDIVITYPYGDVWQSVFIGADARSAFVNVPGVVTSWKLVRDVCNIFFSMILIIIALGTVLRIEKYSWKKTLPDFIIAAILINFSRTICGVFTDAATVAMATFGGSFSNAIGRNILGVLNPASILDLSLGDSDSVVSDLKGLPFLIAGFAAAGFMLTGLSIILTVYVVTLIFRIVMLWFLISISPLAWIGRILPQTQSRIAQKWWDMFGRYVIVGPLITFFLWLSLSIAYGTQADTAYGYNGSPLNGAFDEKVQTQLPATYSKSPETGQLRAVTPATIVNYIVMMLMLAASLKMVNEMATEFTKQLSQVRQGAGKLLGAARQASYRLNQQYLAGRALSSARGRLDAIASDDDRSARARGASRFASNVLQPLDNFSHFTNTVLSDPGKAWKNLKTGVSKASERKQEVFLNESKKRARGMADRDIMGHGYMNGAFASMDNLTGIGIGVTSDDAVKVYEDYDPLSLRTYKRLADKAENSFGLLMRRKIRKNKQKARPELAAELTAAAQRAGTPPPSEADIDAELERRFGADMYKLDEGLYDQKKRLEDYNKNYRSQDEHTRSLLNMRSGVMSDADTRLDTTIEPVRRFIQDLIAQLKTDLAAATTPEDKTALQAQIERVQQALREGSINSKKLFKQHGSYAPGALRLGLTGALNSSLNKVKNEYVRRNDDQHDVHVIDPATADFFDNAGSILDNELSERERQLVAATAESATLEARRHTSNPEHKKLVDEQYQQVQNIDDGTELMGYLTRAKKEKNRYLAEAVHKRLQETGGLLWFGFDQYLRQSDNADARAHAGSGHGAMEAFRTHHLKEELGMSDQESMRYMQKLVAKFTDDNIDLDAAYVSNAAGVMRPRGKDERAALQAGGINRRQASNVANTVFGVVEGNDTTLAPSDIQKLIRYGHDYSYETGFRWLKELTRQRIRDYIAKHSDASDPENLKNLGVPEEFIRAVRDGVFTQSNKNKKNNIISDEE
ncbi:MAG: MFS transporter [Candidatus Kerfeldbacteria bacterium]|nr:MFS transporter [Candidatus Kerfeldbacteria bacterium]